jgi:hypothetical protein
MSIPGFTAIPTAVSSAVAIGALSPFEQIAGFLNTNPYFIGIMMLLLNLGGRFIGMEVSKDQENFFQQQWIRRLLIFVVLFVATRNVLIAFSLWIIVIFAIGYLFNENSSLCIYRGFNGSGEGFTKNQMASFDGVSSGSPSGSPSGSAPGSSSGSPSGLPSASLSQEESDILRKLADKQQRITQQQEQEKFTDKQPVSPLAVYLANMRLMNNY